MQGLVRLGDGQGNLLVRDREHEEGGAHFVFDFEGISSSSFSTEEATSILSSPFPHLHNPTSPAIPTLSNSPFTYRYRTSHSRSSITPPCTILYRCMHTSNPPSTPTPARRTDAALSVSVRSWGAIRRRGRAGRGGPGLGAGRGCRRGWQLGGRGCGRTRIGPACARGG